MAVAVSLGADRAAESDPEGSGTADIERQTRYLTLAGGPARVVTHAPVAPGQRSIGVVLCPPFGWDDIFTYRSYVHWADSLARAGFNAMRVDLPGTGESAGRSTDVGLVPAWLEAIDAASLDLRASCDAERIVGLGVGLGGFLAHVAAARGGTIDDLVLWAVPARGKAVLREMHAFARFIVDANPLLRDSRAGSDAAGAPLDLAGMLLAADAAAEIAALDLTALPLPMPVERRVLVLGRDKLSPDRRLATSLRASGVDVELAPGLGYARMVDKPSAARTPRETFAVTLDWLARTPEAPRRRRRGPTGIARGTAASELLVDGIRERDLIAHYRGQRMYGTLSEPAAGSLEAADLCIVLLTPGAGRRSGPQRMWVDAARRWAARGVAAVRIDVAGVGESEGEDGQFPNIDSFYREELTTQVRAALDAVANSGFSGRFLLGGLCSAAFWSFRAALDDERVSGTFLLFEPATLFRSELSLARADVPLKRYLRGALALLARGRVAELLRLARDEHRAERVLRSVARRIRRLSRRPQRFPIDAVRSVDDAFARLHTRGAATTLVVDPADATLATAGRVHGWPGVELESLTYCVHTIGPPATQEAVHAALDRAVERALATAR